MPLPPSFPQVLFACGAAQRTHCPLAGPCATAATALRICGGRFLVGAGGSYAVGDTGGAASETLKQFNHTGGSWVEDLWAYGKDDSTHDNRPPYYALCYIMKL